MQQLIKYNSKLKDRAKHMRKNSSRAEIALWSGLKNKQIGIRFVRQKILNSLGVTVFRVSNEEVLKNGEGAVQGIQNYLREHFKLG